VRRFVEDPAKAQKEAQPEFKPGSRYFCSCCMILLIEVYHIHKMARHIYVRFYGVRLRGEAGSAASSWFTIRNSGGLKIACLSDANNAC
jgi:hypothetical protein